MSHLYGSLEKRGIRAFKDETENIPKPSEIHLATIRASKIVLVVVSKKYLSSPFLLKELQEILKLQRSRHLTLFPVYYGVDPWDVTTQEKVDLEIREWRKALMELVCISGEHSNNWYAISSESIL